MKGGLAAGVGDHEGGQRALKGGRTGWLSVRGGRGGSVSLKGCPCQLHTHAVARGNLSSREGRAPVVQRQTKGRGLAHAAGREGKICMRKGIGPNEKRAREYGWRQQAGAATSVGYAKAFWGRGGAWWSLWPASAPA